MNNCITKTLDVDLNNNNLPHLNELWVHVNLSSRQGLDGKFMCNEGINLRIEGNGHFTDNAGTADLGKTKSNFKGDFTSITYICAGEYDLIFENKYDIFRIALDTGSPTWKIITEELYGIEELNYLQTTSLNEKYNFDKSENSFDVLIDYNRTMGTIKPSHVNSIRQITIRNNPDVIGDIMDMATEELTTLNVAKCPKIEGGAIEDFIRTIIDTGKTTGTITYKCDKLTLNGSITFSTTTVKVEWADNHVIARNSSNNIVAEADL